MHTQLMGIVNVTPDSFSDGGVYATTDRALAQAYTLVEEGADWIDVGGESTRPGAEPVSIDEELRRVIPVIRTLATQGVRVSADTRHLAVMRAAVEAGAHMINDVSALSEPGALTFCAQAGVYVCLMHMQGTPESMQRSPHYGDVLHDVSAFLVQRASDCEAAGLSRDRIYLDPGFGFGKTLEHNLSLLRHLNALTAAGYPLLVGVSRKSMLGQLTGAAVGNRLAGSLSAALWAANHGATILRVHDVRATRDALTVWNAIQSTA